MTVTAGQEEVFDILEDPDTYPDWLVGASRIIKVDSTWPRVGSKFSHRIGVGPFVMPGSTSIKVIDRPSELVLGAGMGVLGEATVRFRLEQVPAGTQITLEETLTRGPARTPWSGIRLLLGTALRGRNAISLSSLERVVLARSAGKSTEPRSTSRPAVGRQPEPNRARSKRARS
ncbi:MAG: SRPBCC family protein [Microthrixaceae bacterium]